MDVAINSNGFCKAAFHAVPVLAENITEAATLNTTTVIIQIAGFLGIASGGVGVMHLLCELWGPLSDPKSPQFVHNRWPLYVVAGLIAAFVAAPFLLLLDNVSDTILFCHAVEKKREPLMDNGHEEEEEEEVRPSRGFFSC